MFRMSDDQLAAEKRRKRRRPKHRFEESYRQHSLLQILQHSAIIMDADELKVRLAW